jgi:hypothetical protein
MKLNIPVIHSRLVNGVPTFRPYDHSSRQYLAPRLTEGQMVLWLKQYINGQVDIEILIIIHAAVTSGSSNLMETRPPEDDSEF